MGLFNDMGFVLNFKGSTTGSTCSHIKLPVKAFHKYDINDKHTAFYFVGTVFWVETITGCVKMKKSHIHREIRHKM